MSKFELTDEQLIKKFQDGDVGAYNQIVYRYKDRLLNFIYRFLNDLDRSEDLVQDTLLKLYTHKDSYIKKFVEVARIDDYQLTAPYKGRRKIMFKSFLMPDGYIDIGNTKLPYDIVNGEIKFKERKILIEIQLDILLAIQLEMQLEIGIALLQLL